MRTTNRIPRAALASAVAAAAFATAHGAAAAPPWVDRPITLPRLMWMGLRDNIDPAIAAISVILILITVTVPTARIVYRRARGRT